MKNWLHVGIAAGWEKWRELSRLVCDKSVPVGLNVAFYKTVIRPIIMYGMRHSTDES